MNAIFLTTHDLIEQYWPDVSRCLQPVIDHAARGEFEIEDIKRLCDEKSAYTAVVFDDDNTVVLAIAYEFLFYPRLTACNIMALGGKALDNIYNEFFVTFKKWLYGMNVTVLEASCSSSMARLLGRYGFEKTYEVVRHEIT